MGRAAVFVDAGYLFAQGSTALYGSKLPRADISLSARSVIEELKAVVEAKAQGCSLLRIYWYDGTVPGYAMTPEQAAVADLDDTKLRLGFINSHGEQKGVDSLIVTDLIELSRQKAIVDAILVSGDEDVRVGVQIAQNYGVRVHLVGITPAKGSQARTLRQESDTTMEWDKLTVGKFLSKRAGAATPPAPSPVVVEAPMSSSTTVTPLAGDKAHLEKVVVDYVAALKEADIVALEAYWKASERGVPKDFDAVILSQCRDAVKRQLEPEEARSMRAVFRREVLKRS